MLDERKKFLKQIDELKKDDPYADSGYVDDKAAVDAGVRDEISHETITAEIKDIQERLKAIDKALKRIERGTYGYCQRCRRQISIKRLLFVPETLYCIRCEEKLRG